MMLFVIAWRNVWRHKIRSLVVILSIATGLWAGVFMMAFSWGMYRQYVRESVETRLSHVQVHHPLFETNDRDLAYCYDNTALSRYLDSLPEVKAYCSRSIASGMVSSPTAAAGISAIGIHPLREQSVTGLAGTVIRGKYLDSNGRNPILIGEKLALKLKAKLKSKLVITCQDSTGEIVAGAFRVCGIYKSKNTGLDELLVYVRNQDLSKITGTGPAIHETAILLHSDENTEVFRNQVAAKFPELEFKTWRELSPELELVISSFNEFMYIFVGIILLALTFGIINTMLMAVMERVREIGMLMAIGMSKIRIFMMIMLETVFLTLLGGPLGLLAGYLTVYLSGQSGINLSMFSKGLEGYGFSSIVYPELDTYYYLPLTLMTLLTALFSAIYPAWRSVKLNPSESIRKI